MLLLVLKTIGLAVTAVAGLFGLGREFRNADGRITRVGYIVGTCIVIGTLLSVAVEGIEASNADASSREQRRRTEQVVTQLERVADPIGDDVAFEAIWSMPSDTAGETGLLQWIEEGREPCQTFATRHEQIAENTEGCAGVRTGPPPTYALEAFDLHVSWLLDRDPPSRSAEQLVTNAATGVALLYGPKEANAFQKDLESKPEAFNLLAHRGSGDDTLARGDLTLSLPGWSDEDSTLFGFDTVEDIIELTHRATSYVVASTSSNARIGSHYDLRKSFVFLSFQINVWDEDSGLPEKNEYEETMSPAYFSVYGDGRSYLLLSGDFIPIKTPTGRNVYRAGPLGDYVR